MNLGTNSRTTARLARAFMLLAVFSACAPKNAAIPFAPGAGGTLGSAAQSTPDHRRRVRVPFTIVVHRRVHRRGRPVGGPAVTSPSFISPSTQSVTISTNGGTPSPYNIGPDVPGCQVVSTDELVCTIGADVPLGTDTLEVKLWDQAGGTGNLLGVGDTTSTITIAPNQIEITIEGVIASLNVTPLPTPPNGPCGIGQQDPTTAYPVKIKAFDADNNEITGTANYYNPITLTNSDTSGATELSTNTVSSPKQSAPTFSWDGTILSNYPQITASADGAAVGASNTTIFDPGAPWPVVPGSVYSYQMPGQGTGTLTIEAGAHFLALPTQPFSPTLSWPSISPACTIVSSASTTSLASPTYPLGLTDPFSDFILLPIGIDGAVVDDAPSSLSVTSVVSSQKTAIGDSLDLFASGSLQQTANSGTLHAYTSYSAPYTVQSNPRPFTLQISPSFQQFATQLLQGLLHYNGHIGYSSNPNDEGTGTLTAEAPSPIYTSGPYDNPIDNYEGLATIPPSCNAPADLGSVALLDVESIQGPVLQTYWLPEVGVICVTYQCTDVIESLSSVTIPDAEHRWKVIAELEARYRNEMRSGTAGVDASPCSGPTPTPGPSATPAPPPPTPTPSPPVSPAPSPTPTSASGGL